MSDLFHEEVPFEFILQVFEVMAEAERHTFQILTKRHDRLEELAPKLPWSPNVWMDVSVENQRWADIRVPILSRVDATVRFLSVEPLLGSVDLKPYLNNIDWVIAGGGSGPKARPLKPEWVRQIRDACVESQVPFFFKQWGGRTSKAGGRLLDDKVWGDMPARLVAVA